MRKIHALYYLFILLVIFSIIWVVLIQPVTISNRNLFFDSSTTEDPINLRDLSSKDYSQLVNLTNFKFLNLVECTENGHYPRLLIAVHSAASNVEKRQAIRETWGMQRAETKLIFMLGVPEKQDEINIIASEKEKYKDIVQGNFKDSYKNLTYKHVMVLKYAAYHCPKITYLLKTDDDVFINLPNLLSHIEDFNNHSEIAKPHELLYCLPMIGSPAIREKSKWQVTFEEFPDECYPPYCSGFVELFTFDTVIRIYKGAQISRFLWVDDAFVTGVAREAAKIKITPLPNSLHLEYGKMETIVKINNSYPNMDYSFLISVANVNVKSIRDLWNIITHQRKE